MKQIISSQRLTALIILIVLGVFAVLIMPAQTSAPIVTPPQSSTTVTVTGQFACLPHKDQSGPSTLECASGLLALDGTYYALDMSAVTLESDMYDFDKLVAVTGHFTPYEALSSDEWSKYVLVGIISAQTVETVD